MRLRTADELNCAHLMTPPRLTRVARTMQNRDSWAEQLMWHWLRDRRFSEYKFRRQHPFGPHIMDYFCQEARLDIESDGVQYGTPEQQAKDAGRDAWLEARGVKVLRFRNPRLRREKAAIRDTIWRTLQERAPHPLQDDFRSLSEGKQSSTPGRVPSS